MFLCPMNFLKLVLRPRGLIRSQMCVCVFLQEHFLNVLSNSDASRHVEAIVPLCEVSSQLWSLPGHYSGIPGLT